MSDDPFSDQPQGQGRDWGAGPPAGEGPGWGGYHGSGAVVRSASVGKRTGALIIDALGVAIVVSIVLSVLGVSVFGLGQSYIGSLIMSGAAVAYFSLMEASSGQTIAKRMFGIKAVMADGSPVTLQAALIRRLPFYIGNVIPLIGGLVSLALVLAILITSIQDEPEHRGLHDKWAGTKVIDA